MQKITKKDRYLEIRSLILDRPDLVEFIDHEIELVEKKNASRSLKPSKSATENAVLADSVLAVMKEGNRYTITEIQSLTPELDGLSNQRVTAIVRLLMKSGEVIRTEEKSKAYFTKV